MATLLDAAHPELLTCWKDIARYMGKGVRTVQRWEQTLNLPVHRPLGVAHKSSVVAHPHELDAWFEMRWTDGLRRRNGGPSNRTNEIAVTSPIVSLSMLSRGIRASRELRTANYALTKELSIALHALIQSCDQLIARRHEFTSKIDERVSAQL